MSKVLRIAVVTGGLSEESATNRLGEEIVRALRVRAGADTELDVSTISVRQLAPQVASASLSGFANGGLADAYATIGQADAVIALSPTFKASYTGLFKAFWDATEDGLLAGVPVVIAATGGSERHSLMTETAMRPLFAYLGALVMPTAIYAATADWANEGLERRIGRVADELAHVLFQPRGAQERDMSRTAASEARRQQATDPFSNVMTMEQMLNQ